MQSGNQGSANRGVTRQVASCRDEVPQVVELMATEASV